MNKHIERLTRSIRQNLEVACTALREAEADVKVMRAKSFQLVGGCDRCGGRGWVVTWDTLDSLSGCYAEYGRCPEAACTEATRKATGLDRSYLSKYDKLQGVREHVETEEEQDLLVPLRVAVQVLQADLQQAKADLEPAVKGRKVRVEGGRKVPVGTEGTVFWVGEAQGYDARVKGPTRVGIKDASGKVHWTAADNCVATV